MTTMTDEMRRGFMRRAIDLSLEKSADLQGGPFGCVIARDGVIIGEGWNQVTTANDPTAHAEVMAIRDACAKAGTFDLSGAEVFTSCEPCPMCLGALYWARVARIFYGNTRQDADAIGFSDEFLYRELVLPMDKRSIPITNLMRDDAIEAFRRWETNPDKVPY
jgi:tRNA(Arg) A34 adenosine deaminase TadA